MGVCSAPLALRKAIPSLYCLKMVKVEPGTMQALPAWPCQQSIDFKLWRPHAPSMAIPCRGGSAAEGALLNFEMSNTMSPPERKDAVVFAGCVQQKACSFETLECVHQMVRTYSS